MSTHQSHLALRKALYSAVFALSLSLDCLADEVKKKDQIQMVAVQQIISLDPHLAYDWLSYQTIVMVCAGLMTLGHSVDELQPDIAKTVEISEDGKQLTF